MGAWLYLHHRLPWREALPTLFLDVARTRSLADTNTADATGFSPQPRPGSSNDPAERLMDVIAGQTGFLPEFFPDLDLSDISFETIRRIKDEFCPEASFQSALIGIVNAIPRPCILLRAEKGYRGEQLAALQQMRLQCHGPSNPKPDLRVARVSVNSAAQDVGIRMVRNSRVPRNRLSQMSSKTVAMMRELKTSHVDEQRWLVCLIPSVVVRQRKAARLSRRF